MEEGEQVDEENSKNKKVLAKKIAKKALIKMTPALVGILIIVVIATAVFSVFSAIKDKVIEILSNVGTALNKFWKWIRDDYWIKLDDKVETTVTNEETRTRRNGRYNCS